MGMTKKAARKAAEAAADEIAKLSPAKRRALARLLARAELNDTTPTAAAATSDLLRLLQAAGQEFARRYYPDAEYACFIITLPTPDRRSVVLPLFNRPAEGGAR